MTIQERFERFHSAHPEVYKELVLLARGMKKQGHRRAGMRMLLEVYRWRHAMDGKTSVRVNDHYAARYVRMIEESEPYLVGFFRTRKLRDGAENSVS